MSGTSIGNATRLTASGLQPTDVIPVERPGVTTPYKTKLSSLSLAAAGAVNIRDYGALGDGVTDDGASLRAAVAAAGAAGRNVYIPKGRYKITAAASIPSNMAIFGEGDESVIYHSYAATAPADWAGASWAYRNALMVGTWGGITEDPALGHGPSALYGITYYGIGAASAGDYDVTLDVAGEISHFAEGEIVFLKSGTAFTLQTTYNGGLVDVPKYTQVNRIFSIAGAVITLQYPLHHAFDAGASIAPADQGATTGLDGQPGDHRGRWWPHADHVRHQRFIWHAY